MDLKDIVAYLFLGLGIFGVAYFAWASRRKQSSRQAPMDELTRK